CALRELDVRHNSIGDLGVAALAEAITGSVGTTEEGTPVSGLDVLLLEGNELRCGRIGTTAIGNVLLTGQTATLTDLRPYVVDGVVHLAIESA
ncbi:hypothetical protein EON66_01460, partial [archaeon]